MNRGEETIMPNWALELAPTLPGAAGWVLLALARRANYKQPAMEVGDILKVLQYKERSVEMALAFLLAEGHVIKHDRAYVLRGARSRLAQDSRKNLRSETPVEPLQDDKNQPLNKEELRRTKKKEKTITSPDGDTPPTPSDLLSIWNEHCGSLPKAEKIDAKREKLIQALLREHGAGALELFTDAVRQVASDAFWREKRFGMTNVLRHVGEKAEAWRAKHPRNLRLDTPAPQADRTDDEDMTVGWFK